MAWRVEVFHTRRELVGRRLGPSLSYAACKPGLVRLLLGS